MQLITLGTGTCVLSLERSSPGNFLGVGGQKILVDCGSGTIKQLLKAKTSYKDVDMVFFTHLHPDHIGDLNPLISALMWTPDFTRKKDLVLVGTVGFEKFYNDLIRPITGDPLPNTFDIIVKEIKDRLDFGTFAVECTKISHSDMSIAYRFTENGKSLVISGDTDFDQNLIKLATDADMLLIECSFQNARKVKGHMTSREVGIIADAARVKKVLLTHIFPVSTGKVRVSEVKKIFKNAVVAKDLMKVKI